MLTKERILGKLSKNLGVILPVGAMCVMLLGVMAGLFSTSPMPAYATDNQSHTSSYRVSTRGFGVQVGSLIFDLLAARDSSETDSLMLQFGQFSVTTAQDTIVFTEEGLSVFSATPEVVSLNLVNPRDADTLFVPRVVKVTPETLIVSVEYYKQPQYGTYTITQTPDTIVFVTPFSATPVVTSLVRVGALEADTLFAPQVVAVNAETLFVDMHYLKPSSAAFGTVDHGVVHYAARDTTLGQADHGTLDYALLGPR